MSEGKTCCCSCCPVRTGTIIIAVIWLVLGMYNIYVYCSDMMMLTDDENYSPSKIVESYSHEQLRAALEELYTNHRTLMTVYTCLLLIGWLIDAPLSAYMLHVAIKNGPAKRILPWLGFNCFWTVVSILCSILFAFYLTIKLGGASGFMLVLLFLAIYAFVFYLIRVVYYFMQEAQEREGNDAERQSGFQGVAVGFVSNAPPNMQDKSFYM